MLSLAIKNLTRQKARTILTILGTIIGIGSLISILTLTDGVKNLIFHSILSEGGSLNQLIVLPEQKENFLKYLPNNTTTNIDKETYEKIKQIPHIKKITTQTRYDNFSAAQLSFLGQTFQTDALLFGADYESIKNDLPKNYTKEQWDNTTPPYPVLTSKKILDLYNFSIAPTGNLPKLKEEDFKNLELVILPEYSSFFQNNSTESKKQVGGKILAFSDKVDLTGLTLPQTAIQKLNLEHNPNYKETYSKLYIDVDNAENLNQVSDQITELKKLMVNSPEKQIQILEQNFRIITLGLSLISFIILLVSGFSIANTFYSSIQERRREIGILRAVGATKNDILKIFLQEAAIMGTVGGILGIGLGLLANVIIDKIALTILPETSFRPDTLFSYNPQQFIISLAIAITVSIIFAYLPARRASKIQPLQAINS